MKSLIVMLLFTCTIYSQKQVYNVQKYCIDERPFKATGCDISGNEYSFVFIDNKSKQVVLFLSNQRMEYQIAAPVKFTSNGDTVYALQNGTGPGELRISKLNTKMLFTFAERNIMLTVGKSTKS